MEPVLIYTDQNHADVGAVRSFELDLAFGADEQDFEIAFSEPVLSGGELLYIDGTEYGGIVDAVTQSTETDNAIYKGRTWHGMLAGKIVKPATGQNYYSLSGDANACIGSLLAYVGLASVLTARSASAGISVNYQFERFCNAYDGLLKMLASAGAVLRIERHDGITELWAEQRSTIEDEADSDLMDFTITDSVRVPNHLVCAGEGELKDRVIVDLYADADGNVSQTQTLTGVDEIAVLYNYNNADAAELIAEGTKELQSYQLGGGADLQVNSKGDWHVGDSIQVRDNRTGLVITSTIAKKIVKVRNGVLSVDYEVGVASAQSYGGGASAETNLVTPIANGGTGATTAEGALTNLGALPKMPKSPSLPYSGELTNVYPIVLGNTFANDGVISYTTVATFRSMLALNAWATVAIGDYITFTSGAGWSNASTTIRYNAALGVVRIYANWKTSSAKTAGNYTIGTVASAYRPKSVVVSVPTLTSASQNAYIDTSGAFKANLSAISANGTVYYTGEYFIGT